MIVTFSGIKPPDVTGLFSKRSIQVEEIVFSQTSVTTLRKLAGNLSSLKNLKSFQFQFLKSKIPTGTFFMTKAQVDFKQNSGGVITDIGLCYQIHSVTNPSLRRNVCHHLVNLVSLNLF